jgi:hypothetical protein
MAPKIARRAAALGFLLIWLASPALPAPAEEETSLEDALSGFGLEGKKKPDESAEEREREPKKVRSLSWLELSGAASLSSSYNYAHKAPEPGKTDFRGVSRLRGRLDLKLDADLPGGWKARVGGVGYYDPIYSMIGRDKYTSQVLDAYQSEIRTKEDYLAGSLARNLDIKIGRQIVSWGKSDNIRITDVLNPLDLREPGMVDIEDIREPLTMTRLDYYMGPWSLTAVAVHEIAFNKIPPYGSDFYPLATPKPREDIPSSTSGNTEYGLAVGGIFPGFDIAFYLADFYDDNFSLKSVPTIMTAPAVYPLPPGMFPFILVHNRLKMAGVSMNKAMGNFLAKVEAAWFDGLRFTTGADKTFQRVDTLLGVEYSGFTEITISLEVAARTMTQYQSFMGDGPLGIEKTEWQTALRYQQDWIHQTLHLTALINVLGTNGGGGAFQRVSLKYDVMDSFSVTGGVMAYQAGRTPFFAGVEDNDRALAELRYSF